MNPKELAQRPQGTAGRGQAIIFPEHTYLDIGTPENLFKAVEQSTWQYARSQALGQVFVDAADLLKVS